jgi:hypothetical protein
MSEDRLGKVAHAAWCSASGQDQPLWENLSDDIQRAWNAVGQGVLLAVGEKSGLLQEDEDETPAPAA